MQVQVWNPDNGAFSLDKALLEDILGGGAEAGNPSNVAVSDAVGATLTAAEILAGVVTRSGPTAAFSDALPTAALTLAAMGGAQDTPVGSSWFFSVKNTTAFAQTVAAGAGWTLSGQAVVPPLSVGTFLATYSADTPAFTLRGVSVVPLTTSPPLASTALNTVGAGALTAAGIVGGVTTRGGAQSGAAFADTTPTAAAIIAAMPNAQVGQSFIWKYRNATDATGTVTAGSGVTVSGLAAAKPNTSVDYLVTYSAAGAVTMVGLSESAPTSPSGTVVANEGTAVVVANPNVTANSVIVLTLKTAGGAPSGAPFLSAVTPGTGFSVKSFTGDTSTYNYLILN